MFVVRNLVSLRIAYNCRQDPTQATKNRKVGKVDLKNGKIRCTWAFHPPPPMANRMMHGCSGSY